MVLCICEKVEKGKCHWQPCDRKPTELAKLPTADILHKYQPVYCGPCDRLLDVIY